jgi:hypothetical protein
MSIGEDLTVASLPLAKNEEESRGLYELLKMWKAVNPRNI